MPIANALPIGKRTDIFILKPYTIIHFFRHPNSVKLWTPKRTARLFAVALKATTTKKEIVGVFSVSGVGSQLISHTHPPK
jgi:hypothetical protein